MTVRQDPRGLSSDVSNVSEGVQHSRPKRVRKLQAGIRVRVRRDAESPYAGRKGVVLFAGDKICDVKFLPKHPPRRTGDFERELPSETMNGIDSVPREWLESTQPGVDLVSWLRPAGDKRARRFRLLYVASAVGVFAVVIWSIVFMIVH